jgi:hypothetical protein
MLLIGAEKTKRNHWCVILVGVTALAGACPLFAGEALAQAVSEPLVHAPVTPISSDSLVERAMTMAPAAAREAGGPVRQRGDLELTGPLAPVPAAKPPDPLVQRSLGPALAPSAPPTIIRTVEGIPQQSGGLVPPDVSAAVGRNHYVEMVNEAIAIYSKSGTKLFGPVAIHTLWAGLGGPCGTLDAGDPIVRYDVLADRWMISQFELNERIQCIGISKGPNPVTDGWHLYAFPTQTATGVKISADYPKIGVWPDGYYMGTQRGFPNSGLDVWVFEREKMLQGQPAREIQFQVAAPSLFLLPSDLDGPAPPAGAPNVFAPCGRGPVGRPGSAGIIRVQDQLGQSCRIHFPARGLAANGTLQCGHVRQSVYGDLRRPAGHGTEAGDTSRLDDVAAAVSQFRDAPDLGDQSHRQHRSGPRRDQVVRAAQAGGGRLVDFPTRHPRARRHPSIHGQHRDG